MSKGQSIPSYSHPQTTEKLLSIIAGEDFDHKRIVDLGAGPCYFSWKLAEELTRRNLDPGAIVIPCDLNPELFQLKDLQCVRSDFNS